jgi:hypothetical protein
MQDELAKGVWDEACLREGTHPNLLRRDGEVLGPFLPYVARINSDFQFVYDSLSFITDIKMKIMHAVESFYGFDTSQASENIGRNTSRAQVLLTEMRFVYRVRLNSASICSQLTIAVWVTGTQHWHRGSTSSISTSHYPESHKHHVVQEQGR